MRPTNRSVISYLIEGGKHLYVLSKNEENKVPTISEGETLRFRVDVRGRRMEWFRNADRVHCSELIDFQGQFWFPFVVFKDEGDAVELL